MPNINKQYTLDNYWTGNDPRSLMLHTTGGDSLIGAVDTLIARGLSYNYVIYKGNIYELVHWSNAAWHAGVIKRPNIRAQVFYGSLKEEENPNRNSVGIAFVETNEYLDEEDVDAFVRLAKWLGQETGNRYTAENIFAHVEVTYDKPRIVLNFKEQCIEALVGDKDHKDEVKITQMKLIIKLLQSKIRILQKLAGLK